MIKTRKRWVSLLVAVVMVAALVIPFVGTASAGATYGIVGGVASVSATGATQPVSSLEIIMDPVTAQQANGQEVFLGIPTSPSGFALYINGNNGGAAVGGVSAPIDLSAANDVFGQSTAAGAADVSASVYVINQYEVGVKLTGMTPAATVTSYQVVVPMSITVPSGVTGNITLTASAPGNSTYPSGSVVVATVPTAGLTLGVTGTTAISSSGTTAMGTTIGVTENAAGSFNNTNAGGTPLKLTLPPGFSWDTPTAAKIQFMWGDANLIANTLGPVVSPSLVGTDTGIAGNISITNDGREMDLGSAYVSLSATYFQLIGLGIGVDEATAQTGNITVSVGGSATSNVSSIVIGTYGQYGVTAKAYSAPTITAGQTGDTIGELELIEGIPDSLIAGRTVTLTLPTGAVWANYPSIDTSLSTNTGGLGTPQSEMVGTNGNLMQITIKGNTPVSASAGANLFLKNFEVSTAVDFSGPIAVTVGGSEGITGTLTMGNVTAPVTATAASAPSISLGQASQQLGSLTIAESAAGNLSGVTYYSAVDTNETDQGVGDNYGLCISQEFNTEPNLYLLAPSGVTFDTTPTVTVTSGNIQIGSVTTETSDSYLDVSNQGVLVIPIQASSTTASTIAISGLQVTVNNTVPEGPVTFKVEGPAVNQETDTTMQGTPQQINDITGGTAYQQVPFPNNTVVAAVTMGTVTNGIATTVAGTSVFKIGATSYTLNGSPVSMDVAPYIKDGRTFVPLRAVANALGVPDSSIMWDGVSKVTIIKGSLVAQFTIGSTTLLLNGAAITMDVAPEITDSRTCLPVAWAAQALGVTYTWDATAQTVTFTT